MQLRSEQNLDVSFSFVVFGFFFIQPPLCPVVYKMVTLFFQATNDLEEIDKKRKEEFKEYEMTKEHLRRERLKKLNEAERANEQKEFDEMQKKHKDHPKLHHPVSRQPLLC